MALATTQVAVGSSDTVVYTATGAVVEIIVRSRQDGYAIFGWYRAGTLNQAVMPVLHTGDLASFSTLQNGDVIHGISPSGVAVDVLAVT